MYSGGMCTLLRTLLLILFVNCTPPRLNCFQENIIDLYGEDTNLPTAEMIIREEAKRIGLSTAYFDTCSGQWTKKNASVVVYFRQFLADRAHKLYTFITKRLALINKYLVRLDPKARAFVQKIRTTALTHSNSQMLTIVFILSHVAAVFTQTSSLDLVCPPGYVPFNVDHTRWCFAIHTPVFPATSVPFNTAKQLCEVREGESLPILASSGMTFALEWFQQSYSLDYLWIGIICENGRKYSLMWMDGQNVTFNRFMENPDCSESTHFVQTSLEVWVPLSDAEDYLVENYICTKLALTYIPDLPSMPPSLNCRHGMFLIGDWCYSFGVLPNSVDGNYLNVKHYCDHDLVANLPSINSDEVDEQSIIYIRRYFLGVDIEHIWIGLECGSEGTWHWTNKENWSGYSHFVDISEKSVCDPTADFGHLIDNNGNWISGKSQLAAKYYLCSDRPEGYTAPPPDSSSEEGTSDDSDGTTNPQDPDTPVWVWIVIVVCIIGGVAIMLAIIYFIFMRRGKIRKLEEMVEIERLEAAKPKSSVSNPIANNYYVGTIRTDEWEIDRKFVGIDYTSKLGEGAFGSVFIGRVLLKNIPLTEGKSIVELTALRNDNDAVAVKMLHETADGVAERNFRAEIDLMKKIGYHERLVNILACVTLSTPILLISEYCANGDLLAFMRERRKYMLSDINDINDDMIITVRKQMMFAIQIAYGLEYLTSRGFIHRDIAARNIMVDQQESCKIGDFGLCRAIGREEENYQSQGGKLPLKWMSPEAIDKYNFAAASDVWSYGVLLFEIITLGGVPYADWPAAELLSRLKRGERMDRPDGCSDHLFELMSECWTEQPSQRPSFMHIRQRLGLMLENVSQDDYYLRLNAKANYYVAESNTS
ncbi:hypothetical protein PRIPAC_82351 [Pristionchus pacificus]|uniref:Uncharacterized protein n=1 Tax=Pristionchus pacificus TaxID=54126 RepID=A0A2A6CK57_PRIPA|nr:hypothetical protein PRIPAC_82351 [Pristionchus pacificus]|eukprot:PDM78509.1 protein kinase [Pristionchus pacificus]